MGCPSALHLVVESAQRYSCPSPKAWQNFVVVPYSSPAVSPPGHIFIS